MRTASARPASRASATRAAMSSSAGLVMISGGGPLLEPIEPGPQLPVLALERSCGRAQRLVALPPVDAHLTRPLDGGDEQAQLDRQQLDVEQVDLDVAR